VNKKAIPPRKTGEKKVGRTKRSGWRCRRINDVKKALQEARTGAMVRVVVSSPNGRRYWSQKGREKTKEGKGKGADLMQKRTKKAKSRQAQKGGLGGKVANRKKFIIKTL